MNKPEPQTDSLFSIYRTAFKHSLQGFCLLEKVAPSATAPPDFRYLLTNPAFEQQLGIQQSDGKTIRQLVPQLEAQILEHYDRVALTGQPAQFETYVAAFDHWMAGDVFRVGEFEPPWIGVLLTNITQRKQREADLAFLAEVSQDLARLTNIDDTMNVLGQKIAQYLDLSASVFAELYKGDHEGAVTAILSHGWHRPDVPSLLGTYQMEEFTTPEIQQLLLTGQDVIIRNVFEDPRTDGEQYAALHIGSFVGMPLVRDGEWRFLLVIYRTDPHDWSEDEIDLTRELTTRIWTRLERARAEEALRLEDRRKDEFLAMLGHELRNPLASLSNMLLVLELTRGEDESLSYPKAVELMSQQVGHMSRMVDDLLDVGRIRYGLIQLHKERVDLRTLVGQTVEVAQPLYGEHQRQLSLSLPTSRLFLMGDKTRLSQVLMNLLTNGLKYTQSGGHVRVSLELAGTKMSGKQALLRVSDDGIGIAPDQREAIFDIFVQGETTLDRPQGGLGLGLAVVKQLVALHGGSIEVRSEGPGHGSEFLIRLPLTPEAAEPALRAPIIASAVENKGRVLVVEDNQTLADMTARLVGLIGYQAQVSYSGAEALLVAKQWQPQVILLDLGMPQMNGFEFTRQLRQQPWGETVSLIALTGYGQESIKERVTQAGFAGYLLKPLNLPQLRELLQRIMAGKQAEFEDTSEGGH